MTRTGVTERGDILVCLKNHDTPKLWPKAGQNEERWFTALPTNKREVLTVALSAMAAGFYVNCDLASVEEESGINRMYVTKVR